MPWKLDIGPGSVEQKQGWHHEDACYSPSTNWERTITDVVRSVYRDVLLWDLVWNALKHLESLRALHESRKSPEQRLLKDYKQALSHFAYLLEKIIQTLKNGLHLAFVGCRSFRNYFIRQFQDPDDERLHFRYGTNVADHLWWLLQQLHGGDTVDTIGLPSLLDEIERLIAGDSKQSQRLSPRVARTLSDLATLTGLQRQIALSFPVGRVTSAVPPPELSSRMVENMKPIWSLWETTGLEIGIGNFGLDLEIFYYPVDKRRTVKTTAEMRS